MFSYTCAHLDFWNTHSTALFSTTPALLDKNTRGGGGGTPSKQYSRIAMHRSCPSDPRLNQFSMRRLTAENAPSAGAEKRLN
jgi:hypothetical protein